MDSSGARPRISDEHLGRMLASPNLREGSFDHDLLADLRDARAERDGLREWVRDQQMRLWTGLDQAIRYSVNGRWSIAAADVAVGIASAARLVGLTPYAEVPWTLLAGRVYEGLAEVVGISPVLPDAAEWKRLSLVMMGHGGTRAEMRDRLALTVAALRADAAYIRDEAA